MNTALVVDAVVALLRTEYEDGLNIPVGDGESPDLSKMTAKSLETPHIIVYEIPIGAQFESEGYGGGQGMETVRLQFTVVGLTAQQVRETVSQVLATVIDRNPADMSTWIHPIVVADHAVIRRLRAGKIPPTSAGLGYHGGTLCDLLVQSTG